MIDLADNPADAVLAQDACMNNAIIDYDRWATTVFFPLTLVGDGRTFVIETKAELTAHLKALKKKVDELGVVAIRTRILSTQRASKDVAVISSVRERVGSRGELIGSTSVTWTVLNDGGAWKINQILFNDDILDPSVVAQVFLGRGNKG